MEAAQSVRHSIGANRLLLCVTLQTKLETARLAERLQTNGRGLRLVGSAMADLVCDARSCPATESNVYFAGAGRL